jgi:MFS family permease
LAERAAAEEGNPVAIVASRETFYGWRVVGAAFVLAVFGWGVGFFGPPVFLSTIQATRGWPLWLVSTAVTVHFLVGAIVGARLPHLYKRFGASPVTKAGALSLGLGVLGWATAAEPWQLFAATALSGAGWGTMSASAVNALVSPWFVRARPAALGMAYNGGSVGGIVFSPLWVAAIAALGFPLAAALVGLLVAVTMWILAERVFSRDPDAMGLAPDGDAQGSVPASITSRHARPLPGALLWRDRQFQTLAAAMALGLFAQIGLVAHLFSLMAPALGAQQAGLAMGLVTVMAVAGRMLIGWLMPFGADRRLVASICYALQAAGSVVFACAGGTNTPLLLLGVLLFGAGFGAATSMPPLIAQVEFVRDEVTRVVALIVGISQATYAFAPAAFGLVRELAPRVMDAAPGAAPWLFATAALAQGLAILAFLAARGRS